MKTSLCICQVYPCVNLQHDNFMTKTFHSGIYMLDCRDGSCWILFNASLPLNVYFLTAYDTSRHDSSFHNIRVPRKCVLYKTTVIEGLTWLCSNELSRKGSWEVRFGLCKAANKCIQLNKSNYLTAFLWAQV